MKLWLIKPKDIVWCSENYHTNPWVPWYGKVFGFVIAADSEDEARKIADDNGGEETGKIETLAYRTGGHPWFDSDLSKCECVASDYEGKEGVILRDKRDA